MGTFTQHMALFTHRVNGELVEINRSVVAAGTWLCGGFFLLLFGEESEKMSHRSDSRSLFLLRLDASPVSQFFSSERRRAGLSTEHPALRQG